MGQGSRNDGGYPKIQKELKVCLALVGIGHAMAWAALCAFAPIDNPREGINGHCSLFIQDNTSHVVLSVIKGAHHPGRAGSSWCEKGPSITRKRVSSTELRSTNIIADAFVLHAVQNIPDVFLCE